MVDSSSIIYFRFLGKFSLAKLIVAAFNGWTHWMTQLLEPGSTMETGSGCACGTYMYLFVVGTHSFLFWPDEHTCWGSGEWCVVIVILGFLRGFPKHTGIMHSHAPLDGNICVLLP